MATRALLGDRQDGEVLVREAKLNTSEVEGEAMNTWQPDYLLPSFQEGIGLLC